jgi:hypothetical protein
MSGQDKRDLLYRQKRPTIEAKETRALYLVCIFFISPEVRLRERRTGGGREEAAGGRKGIAREVNL